MADSMIPLISTLQTIWHIGAWGLAIVLAVLWVWELSASWQHAKAEKGLQDWSSQASTSNLSRLDVSCTEMADSAKANSDIVSRISRPAVQRQEF
jgi:hypothetical protein